LIPGMIEGIRRRISRRGVDEENEMNRNLKILVLLVTLSLVSAFAFAPTEVRAGDKPSFRNGDNLGHLNLTVSETGTLDADLPPDDDGGGTTEGDPDAVGGGYGVNGVRGDLFFWGAEYEGKELETVERWLLFLMLQVLPTP